MFFLLNKIIYQKSVLRLRHTHKITKAGQCCEVQAVVAGINKIYLGKYATER